MKFLTLENGYLGAVIGESVINLGEASRALSTELAASTLLELAGASAATLEDVWSLADRAIAMGIATRALSTVAPLAPIPNPTRNIYCLGLNYRAHADEFDGVEVPESPIVFTKATTAINAPGADIPSHAGVTQAIDYEAEVALVIGRSGRNIAPEDAWGHVFGYTAINDVSARDLQFAHKQWFLGKSLDGFAPMGPVVVHRSVMPEPAAIGVRSIVNGEVRQDATFDTLIFDVPTIIATLSRGATLLVGDIIATGTPAGVGMAFDPPKYLQPGDEVTIDITGVGPLTNRIASA